MQRDPQNLPQPQNCASGGLAEYRLFLILEVWDVGCSGSCLLCLYRTLVLRSKHLLFCVVLCSKCVFCISVCLFVCLFVFRVFGFEEKVGRTLQTQWHKIVQ